ncbi:hypothetical protein K1719_031563 [Acacia pycnantha]|nr:hypothetical protein K1719_031563 [Acacia pycnantha]
MQIQTKNHGSATANNDSSGLATHLPLQLEKRRLPPTGDGDLSLDLALLSHNLQSQAKASKAKQISGKVLPLSRELKDSTQKLQNRDSLKFI